MNRRLPKAFFLAALAGAPVLAAATPRQVARSDAALARRENSLAPRGTSLDLARQYASIDRKLLAVLPAKARFKKSIRAFRTDINSARSHRQATLFPWSIEDPTLFPEAYRVDSRSPDLVKAAGGLVPNPSSPVGNIARHVENGGSGSYVSFSRELTPNVVFNTYFFPHHPARFLRGGKLSDTVSPDEWVSLEQRTWPASIPLDRLPSHAVFETYVYRARNVSGAPIVGGRFGTEKEVVTRGVKYRDGIEWCRVVVTVPIAYARERLPNGKEVIRMNDDGWSSAGTVPRQPGTQVLSPDPENLFISRWRKL